MVSTAAALKASDGPVLHVVREQCIDLLFQDCLGLLSTAMSLAVLQFVLRFEKSWLFHCLFVFLCILHFDNNGRLWFVWIYNYNALQLIVLYSVLLCKIRIGYA